MGTAMCTGLCAYGYVFQLGTQNVPQGDEINYSNNGPLFNITHTPGEEEIIVELAGDYEITFAINTTGNNPQDWGIAVNDAVVASFNAAGQSITGGFALTLAAGDVITMRNTGTLPDPAVLRNVTPPTISTWLQIKKLDANA